MEIAAARGEALGDDLAAVTGTSLDKGVELALLFIPQAHEEIDLQHDIYNAEH